MVDALSLRGNGDFASVEDYQAWLEEQVRRRNRSRRDKLEKERALMAELPPSRLPEYEEVPCRVNKYGLVCVGKGSYSVPAKFRGLPLRARIFERGIELWHEHACVARFEQSPNTSGAAVDWRHLIEDLSSKPLCSVTAQAIVDAQGRIRIYNADADEVVTIQQADGSPIAAAGDLNALKAALQTVLSEAGIASFA